MELQGSGKFPDVKCLSSGPFFMGRLFATNACDTFLLQRFATGFEPCVKHIPAAAKSGLEDPGLPARSPQPGVAGQVARSGTYTDCAPATSCRGYGWARYSPPILKPPAVTWHLWFQLPPQTPDAGRCCESCGAGRSGAESRSGARPGGSSQRRE